VGILAFGYKLYQIGFSYAAGDDNTVKRKRWEEEEEEDGRYVSVFIGPQFDEFALQRDMHHAEAESEQTHWPPRYRSNGN
jgi:hypothetical protein